MNRTAFSLPEKSQYRTMRARDIAGSGAIHRQCKALDDLIDLLDRRRGVVLSSGTTVPGRYESFDLGFADPPLCLETTGSNFSLEALNPRGEVLIAFLGDVLREPCVVITRERRAVSPATSSAARRRSMKTSAPPRQRNVAGTRPRGGARRQ